MINVRLGGRRVVENPFADIQPRTKGAANDTTSDAASKRADDAPREGSRDRKLLSFDDSDSDSERDGAHGRGSEQQRSSGRGEPGGGGATKEAADIQREATPRANTEAPDATQGASAAQQEDEADGRHMQSGNDAERQRPRRTSSAQGAHNGANGSVDPSTRLIREDMAADTESASRGHAGSGDDVGPSATRAAALAAAAAEFEMLRASVSGMKAKGTGAHDESESHATAGDAPPHDNDRPESRPQLPAKYASQRRGAKRQLVTADGVLDDRSMHDTPAARATDSAAADARSTVRKRARNVTNTGAGSGLSLAQIRERLRSGEAESAKAQPPARLVFRKTAAERREDAARLDEYEVIDARTADAPRGRRARPRARAAARGGGRREHARRPQAW